MTKLAPRSTQQAAEFLVNQHETGSLRWRALCLQLQRMARGLPAVFPSAASAAAATPESERVTRVADLRRGMVAYSDDPHDGNPWGHIYFIAGWNGPKSDPSNLLTWSNDIKRSGGVDLVPITAYRANWGDAFQFGATWLNGYDFSEFEKPPKVERAYLGENYHHAIEDVRKSLQHHRKKGHDRLVKALENDLERMRRRYKKFKK